MTLEITARKGGSRTHVWTQDRVSWTLWEVVTRDHIICVLVATILTSVTSLGTLASFVLVQISFGDFLSAFERTRHNSPSAFFQMLTNVAQLSLPVAALLLKYTLSHEIHDGPVVSLIEEVFRAVFATHRTSILSLQPVLEALFAYVLSTTNNLLRAIDNLSANRTDLLITRFSE
jgi:hypothetical protein